MGLPLTINQSNQIYNQVPIYKDIADSFSAHPVTKDLVLVTGVSSIVQSVMNLVSLNHWEIPFHGETGGNVRDLLFELADPTTAALIAQEITDVLTNFEPRVSNVQVFVSADAGGNGWNVEVQFQPIGGSNAISVAFFLTRTR